MILSKRALSIKPFIAMDILEAAQKLSAEGHEIFHFGLGEPDLSPPEGIQEACIEAIKKGDLKYTHSQGQNSFRNIIAQFYEKNYGVKVDPDCIIVTSGTSPAFFLVFSALLNPGDEVILPNPYYPCDLNFIEYLGGKAIFLELKEEEDYAWNQKELERKISKKTKAILLTSPSNPLGTIASQNLLEFLSHLNIPIVSDEIYHGLNYAEKDKSMLQFSKSCFVINGFSKSFGMTGYRLGFTIIPPRYVDTFRKIQQNFFISANPFVQAAGAYALTHCTHDLEIRKKIFQKRRDVMIDLLSEMGLAVRYHPLGAFYLFVDTSSINPNSYELAFQILNQAHVATTPGIDFGSCGEGHLRFSYATDEEKIRKGMMALKNFLKQV